MGKRQDAQYGWILAGAAAVFGIAATTVRSAYECRTLVKGHYYISDCRIKKPCTIVFLSDLHGRHFGKENEELIEAILEQKPSAVLIGGDMMVVKSRKRMDYTGLQEVLQGVSDKVPIFYAEGNHEQRMRVEEEKFKGWYPVFQELLERYHVNMLSDETVMITEEIAVSGLQIEPDFYERFTSVSMSKRYVRRHLQGGFSEKKTLFPKPDILPFHILMAHTPQYMESYWASGTDLVLSGHYHGGVAVLPFVGSVISPQFQLFPPYARGLYKSKKYAGKAIVSAGLGTHSVNIRLFNKPELIIIHLDGEG